MIFEQQLIKGRLIKRYKRFLADIILENGDIVTAHCANSGSMMGLQDKDSIVWLRANKNPKAKLDWRWEIASQNNNLVGINTSRSNEIVADFILSGKMSELNGYTNLRREVKYGKSSRIDILLEDDNKPLCYVEVKNVTLNRPNGKYPDHAEFPDAVTTRGTKHLNELSYMIKLGHRAAMFYLIQRNDCKFFRLADDIDNDYKLAFNKALEIGVEVFCYSCEISPQAILINKPIELKF